MRRLVLTMSALLVLLAFGAGAAGSSAGGGRPTASLDLYTGVVSSETLARIVRQGYDIADARPAAGAPNASRTSSADMVRTNLRMNPPS